MAGPPIDVELIDRAREAQTRSIQALEDESMADWADENEVYPPKRVEQISEFGICAENVEEFWHFVHSQVEEWIDRDTGDPMLLYAMGLTVGYRAGMLHEMKRSLPREQPDE